MKSLLQVITGKKNVRRGSAIAKSGWMRGEFSKIVKLKSGILSLSVAR